MGWITTRSGRHRTGAMARYLLVAGALLSACNPSNAFPLDESSALAISPTVLSTVSLISRAKVDFPMERRDSVPFTSENLVNFLRDMGSTTEGFFYTGWKGFENEPGSAASDFVKPYTEANLRTWFNTVTQKYRDQVLARFGNIDLKSTENNAIISTALAQYATTAEVFNGERGAPGNFWDQHERPVLHARGVQIKHLKQDAKSPDDYYAIEDQNGITYKEGYTKGGKGKTPSPPGSTSGKQGASGCGKKRDGACGVKGYLPGALGAPVSFSDPLPGDMSYDPGAKKVYFRGKVYTLDNDGRLQDTEKAADDKGNAPDIRGLTQVHDLSQSEGYLMTSAGPFSIIEGAFMEQRQGSQDWIHSKGPAPSGLKTENGDLVVELPDVFHGAVLITDPTKGTGLKPMTSDESRAFLRAAATQIDNLVKTAAAKGPVTQNKGQSVPPGENGGPTSQSNTQAGPQVADAVNTDTTSEVQGTDQVSDQVSEGTSSDSVTDQVAEDPSGSNGGNKPKPKPKPQTVPKPPKA